MRLVRDAEILQESRHASEQEIVVSIRPLLLPRPQVHPLHPRRRLKILPGLDTFGLN